MTLCQVWAFHSALVKTDKCGGEEINKGVKADKEGSERKSRNDLRCRSGDGRASRRLFRSACHPREYTGRSTGCGEKGGALAVQTGYSGAILNSQN